MTEEVALLGGTFDPIHYGHIRVFRQVLKTLHFDQGWLLVAGDPQLRESAVLAPADRRLEMARAAAALEGWSVCDIETTHQGPTYTVDTLRTLRRMHPEFRFTFVLGADAARQIQRWHEWRRLIDTTPFVITNRSNQPELTAAEVANLGFADARLVTVDSPPISATAVRERLASGEAIDDLVPPQVAEIIRRNGLYAETAGSAWHNGEE